MKKYCWICGRNDDDFDKIIDKMDKRGEMYIGSPDIFIKKETDVGKVDVCISCFQIMTKATRLELKDLIGNTDIMEEVEDENED